MKTFAFKLFVTMWVCLLPFISGCKKDNESSLDKLNVSVCGAKKTQWLEKEIASIILRSSIYRPTRILVYRGPEKEIIAIEDSTNSSMEQQLRFFDCAGNKVAFKSAEYNSCVEKWKRREFSLLWTN